MEVPDFGKLSAELMNKIRIDAVKKTITPNQPLLVSEEAEIQKYLSSDGERAHLAFENQEFKDEMNNLGKSPSERGVPFPIPVLCIMRADQLELFEEDRLLERGWNLNDHNPKLTVDGFNGLNRETGQFGEIDVGREGKIRSKFIPELNRKMELIDISEDWSDAQLIDWLDRNLLFMDISAQEKEIFLTSVISDLVDRHGMNIGKLARKKFQLRKIVEEKIKTYRRAEREKSYQKLLFGEDTSKIVISPERCFTFNPDQYPARNVCPDSEGFNKHYYPKVGELESSGEEFLCAKFIDQLDQIEVWVRNLERQEKFSFWLQTASDKFYPDFVCKLKDGRFLVVEYKGADRWSTDDAKEKRRLGELWALKSNGQCLFIMPNGKQWSAIEKIIK